MKRPCDACGATACAAGRGCGWKKERRMNIELGQRGGIEAA